MWKHIDVHPSPAPRSSSAHTTFKGKLYIFGGLGPFRHNDLWCWDWTLMTWSLLHDGGGGGTSSPVKRSKAAMGAFEAPPGGVHLVIHGGWIGGEGGSAKLNDLWCFHVDEGRWEEIRASGQLPTNRSSHSFSPIVSNTYLYLFGGIGANKYGETYKLNVHTWAWSLGGMNAGPPRSSYGSITHNQVSNELYIFGGLTCGQLNDVIKLDVGSATTKPCWSTVEVAIQKPSSLIPFKRGRHDCILLEPPCCLNPTILVFGGTNLRTRDNALFAFDLYTRTWREVRGVRSPPPMEAHTMSLSPDGTMLMVTLGMTNKGWTNNKVYVLDLVGCGVCSGAKPLTMKDTEEYEREPSTVEDVVPSSIKSDSSDEEGEDEK